MSQLAAPLVEVADRLSNQRMGWDQEVIIIVIIILISHNCSIEVRIL